MANISFLRWKIHTEILRVHYSLMPNRMLSSVSSSSSAETDQHQQAKTELEIEEAWAQAEEEAKFEQLQNVSGLPPTLYRHLHGQMVEPPYKDLKRRRRMYLTHGAQSGENPRLLWPSKQELASQRMEDAEDEVSLLEKISLMKLDKDEAAQAKLQRQKIIEKNMAQMDKWISEYHNRVDEAEAEVLKKKEKKEALLEEAREYFGYRIKANDPKFQQMVEEKEERDRKEAKERKKKEKARKLAERLKLDVLAMKMSSGGAAEEKP